MNDALTWILDVVQSIDPVLRTVLAGFGMLLETSILVGLIIPGDTILIVTSTGVENPVQGVALVVAVVVGALCGESIGYALGKYFGSRIRASRVGARIGEKNWERAEFYLARRGGIAVFISRFLPVLHSLVPLTVGMSGMRYRTFMAWTLPACLIWSVGYVSVGALAAGTYRELSGQLRYAGFIFVGIIVGFALLVLVGRRLLERRERRYLRPPSDELPETVGPGND